MNPEFKYFDTEFESTYCVNISKNKRCSIYFNCPYFHRIGIRNFRCRALVEYAKSKGMKE